MHRFVTEVKQQSVIFVRKITDSMMMNETDIRKEAYRRILKRELCWWLVAIAGGLLLAGVFSGSGIVNLFLHGFQGIGSCWAGIICLVVTGYIAYSLLGILREKRKLIGHGIQAEAVVTAIQKEIDVEEGGEAFVAVYEFTLPGGRKWKVKEQLNGSQAGLLGLIEVGSRVPVFVDRDHPYKFYLYTHLLVRQFYEEDKTFVNSLEKLKRQGTNVGNIGEAILRHQERGQRVFRSRRKWRWLPSAIVAFVMVLVTAFGYIIYNRFEAYVLVSDLNLPPGFSYYNAYATELHEYLPGNNRWSYTDEDGYEDWTSSWRFTDKCKRPMFVVWGTQGLTHTRTTSMLMIPESYRDRLDEFIYDMNADLKPKLQKLLKGFAPRTGLCILSPVLKDTMQIEGGGYWPLLTLGGACATAAAEIRLKASGVNPDTLRVDKTTMFYYATIEAVSDRDTLATDAVTRIAGGVELRQPARYGLFVGLSCLTAVPAGHELFEVLARGRMERDDHRLLLKGQSVTQGGGLQRDGIFGAAQQKFAAHRVDRCRPLAGGIDGGTPHERRSAVEQYLNDSHRYNRSFGLFRSVRTTGSRGRAGARSFDVWRSAGCCV